LTKTLLLKRNTKKKSGYTVAEEDSGYYLENTPSKARVNPGDRIVGINGIPAEEFLDEDDANGLIESIRIVVVPKNKIDEYDHVNGRDTDGSDDEDYEEYDRSRGAAAIPRRGNEGADDVIVCEHCNNENVNLVPDEDGDLVCEECGHVIDSSGESNGVIYNCGHCGHMNEDLEPDEDGDLVCEECGHVMEPDVIHYCDRCEYENKNLERDEEGDLVCEQCGCVIEEDNAPKTDGSGSDKKSKDVVYDCPDCDNKMVNPERDEEGDMVCDECGCILPEKNEYECDVCKHVTVDPEKDTDGDYFCENCGSALEVDEEDRRTAADRLREINEDSDADSDAGEGQQFDENGTPVTNAKGKKLTPADMFNPGDVITVTVGKSNPKQDPGLKVEDINGKYYVRKVPTGGLFAKTPVIAGDKVLELNGVDSHEYRHVNEMKKVLKDEQKITVVVLRRDPDASESSASSVDYDELQAIKPPVAGENEDESDTARETEDDDTAPYDGESCGCNWCPRCHELEN